MCHRNNRRVVVPKPAKVLILLFTFAIAAGALVVPGGSNEVINSAEAHNGQSKAAATTAGLSNLSKYTTTENSPGSTAHTYAESLKQEHSISKRSLVPLSSAQPQPTAATATLNTTARSFGHLDPNQDYFSYEEYSVEIPEDEPAASNNTNFRMSSCPASLAEILNAGQQHLCEEQKTGERFLVQKIDGKWQVLDFSVEMMAILRNHNIKNNNHTAGSDENLNNNDTLRNRRHSWITGTFKNVWRKVKEGVSVVTGYFRRMRVIILRERVGSY